MSDGKFSARERRRSERDQLDLFRASAGDLSPCDAQDLMAYPFFSLAKSRRIAPMREIVRRQALPGYRLVITQDPHGAERLNFAPIPVDAFAERLRKRGLVPRSGGSL
jgi:hypothetical protein